jgi:TetR/AcrR family transcriptional regulator
MGCAHTIRFLWMSYAHHIGSEKTKKELDTDGKIWYNLSNWLVRRLEKGFAVKAKDSPRTKLKILEAAEKLFAEKGFDGARVDDIAEKAGVNKALIYYYFKSKRDILDELFSSLIEELAEIGYSLVEDMLNFESAAYKEEDISSLAQTFYRFLEEKKDTIRIMMMESLKASEEKPPLFRFSEILISDEAERLITVLRNKGLNVDAVDMDEAFIADFFTGYMPMFSFLVYSEKWSKHFDIDAEELKRKFFSVFQTTHLAYHKAQLMKMK